MPLFQQRRPQKKQAPARQKPRSPEKKPLHMYLSALTRMQDLKNRKRTSTSRERAIAKAGKKTVDKKKLGKFLTGKASPQTNRDESRLGKMIRATKDFNKKSGVTVTGKAYQLARKRKPSGRLNVQDIENAKKSLKLYNKKKKGALGLIKGFAQDARNAILGGKQSKYTPNTRRGPRKAMGPVGGVPVNKKGTKIMKRRGGGIVKRGMGMAK